MPCPEATRFLPCPFFDRPKTLFIPGRVSVSQWRNKSNRVQSWFLWNQESPFTIVGFTFPHLVALQCKIASSRQFLITLHCVLDTDDGTWHVISSLGNRKLVAVSRWLKMSALLKDFGGGARESRPFCRENVRPHITRPDKKPPRRSSNFSNNTFGRVLAPKKLTFEFGTSTRLSQVDTRASGKRIADSPAARTGSAGPLSGEMRK